MGKDKRGWCSVIITTASVILPIVALSLALYNQHRLNKWSHPDYTRELKKQQVEHLMNQLYGLNMQHDSLCHSTDVPTSVLKALNDKRGELIKRFANVIDGQVGKKILGESFYEETVCIEKWNTAIYRRVLVDDYCPDLSELKPRACHGVDLILGGP